MFIKHNCSGWLGGGSKFVLYFNRIIAFTYPTGTLPLRSRIHCRKFLFAPLWFQKMATFLEEGPYHSSGNTGG